MNYQFDVPKYIYTTSLIHPSLELYRYQLMNQLIATINSTIKTKYPKVTISIRKIRQYMAQFIMTVISSRTKSNVIHLDDGLFNHFETQQLASFYDDLNYNCNKRVFTIDVLNIKQQIDNILASIAAFTPVTTRIYKFASNKFMFTKAILDKFDLTVLTDGLVVDDEIIDKNRMKYTGPKDSFLDYLLCCLIRYHCLGSGANQFVVDLDYKRQLREVCGVDFECFASCLNRFYDNYCSMFYDIEQYFGSSGSFMGLTIQQGFYFANPPYDAGLMQDMYAKVRQSLASAKPVGFIISIPKWKDYQLETQINNDELYITRQLKYEYFINPSDKTKALIPPYLSYLFLNEKYQADNKINDLVKVFSEFTNYHLEFPSRNRFYDQQYKLAIFDKLKRMRLSEVVTEKPVTYKPLKINNIDYLYHGKYHFITVDNNNYKYYMLSDLFNDECRSQCSFNGELTPFDYFVKNKNIVIETLIDKQLDINPVNLREQIYQLVPECSTHNPLLIKYFINKFNAKKILDPCSGWGDRLIGALSSNVDLYIGVDPNECLHDNYLDMISLLRPVSDNPKARYMMEVSPFETFNIPDIMFDLVYTSPHYFDYEIYTAAKTQSIFHNPTEDDWLHNFLYVLVDKCCHHLVNHGHLVLYISQGRQHNYIEKFLKWVRTYRGLYYMGNVFKSNKILTKLHPIFIFEKSDVVPVALYNPPLQIETFVDDKRTLHVVRDDLLTGGTKSRGAVAYFQELLQQDIDELIYTGANNGYGQVAVAHALYLLKASVKLTIFYQPVDIPYIERIRSLTSYLYPVNYVKVNQPMRKIWEMITEYKSKRVKCFEIPFGLDDEQFKSSLMTALAIHLHQDIQRLWLVGGIGTLYQVLLTLLPQTQFNLVQVGREITLNEQQRKNTRVYKSSYKLHQDIDVKVPYPTVASYDAKIWEFRDEFVDGDYIWNVAEVHGKI